MSAPDDARARLRRAAPWLLVAAVALAHQALAAAPAVWSGGGDAPKYLALAREAPSHRLYDGHVYVIHPPLFPLLLRATAEVSRASLPTAGALLASLATVGSALLVFAGARRLNGSLAGGLAAGLLFAISRAAVFCGQGVHREPVQSALLLALLAVALPVDPDHARRPWRVVASAALGAALALTYDPFVLLVPVLLAGAWWTGRARALLAAALALGLVWGGWAVARHLTLRTVPEYAAGIDGTVEETRLASAKTFFNPNFFPRTAEHNAEHWPMRLAPAAALEIAAPWCVHDEGPFLDVVGVETPAGRRTAGLLVAVVALLGAVALLRRRPPEWRLLAVAAAALLLVGAPGVLGSQVRYAYTHVVVLALLMGEVAAFVARRARDERAVTGVVVAVAVASALAFAASHRVAAWPRPQAVEGRGVAAWLEASPGAASTALAAPVGLVPDLCWLLPGRRVVTLPFTDERLFELLERRGARLIVLAHENQPSTRPGAPRESWRAVHEAAREGRLRHLGTVLEAEVTDRARARAFDLFWRPSPDAPGPAAFGLAIEPGCQGALRVALEQGALSPETRRLLASALDQPGERSQ